MLRQQGQLCCRTRHLHPAGQPATPATTPTTDKGLLLMLRAGTATTSSRASTSRGRCRATPAATSTARTSPTATRRSMHDRRRRSIQEPGNMVGPTIQGIEDLIAKDPDALLGRRLQVRRTALSKPSPRVFPIPLYDPDFYADGQTERPQRRLQDRELPRILRRSSRRQRGRRPHHADRRHGRRQRRSGARRRVSQSYSAGGVDAWHNSSGLDRQRRRRVQESSSAGCCGRAPCRSASPTSGRAARARRPTSSSWTSAATRRPAMATIERLRRWRRAAASSPSRRRPSPDLILQAMRAGANEFFVWPPARRDRSTARFADRRAPRGGAGRQPAATTLVFFGAKGGAGTTTMAVNCGVEVARLTKRRR